MLQKIDKDNNLCYTYEVLLKCEKGHNFDDFGGFQ